MQHRDNLYLIPQDTMQKACVVAMVRKARHQGGFTLMETILAMVVAVFMMVFMVKMQASASSDLRAKNTAEALQSFTQLAGQYFLANTAGMMEEMKTGVVGTVPYCVINVTDMATGAGTTANNSALHTCAVDGSFLKYKKILPTNFNETNAYNQRWTAIFKLVYNTTTGLPTGDVELLVVGATNGGAQKTTSGTELGLAAELMGSNGGFVPAANLGTNCTTTQACGTGGSWKANLADFLPTPAT